MKMGHYTIDFKKLEEILPKEGQILQSNIDSKYQSDHLGRLLGVAEAVLFPESTEQVSKILAYAHQENIPVTPRGAGTNLVGSTVPDLGGLVLDLSEMNKILEIDEKTMTATVEAGLLLSDFQQYVENLGFFYPPDPGEKKSSLGGNISTNAGGMRAVKYGVTRDYVRGLEVVQGDGTVLTLGGKQVKDASGLSLKELVIGSEGTLCVITKCLLKILPKPQSSLSVLVAYSHLNKAISSVGAILQEGLQPTAIEFMERSAVAYGEDYLKKPYPFPEAGAYLLLIYDGTPGEVEANIKKTELLLKERGATDVLVLDKAEDRDFVWLLRGSLVKAVEAVTPQIPLDMVVPLDKIPSFMAYVGEISTETKVSMIGFGHAGDGNIHLCVLEDDHEEAFLHQVMEKLYAKAHALGGVTSGEHGIGLSKQCYFHANSSPDNLVLMSGIKSAFDPKGILNQGKSYLERKTKG